MNNYYDIPSINLVSRRGSLTVYSWVNLKNGIRRPSASVDNILLDPHNSSHRSTSQPHSIIAKYTGYQTGFIYHYYYSFKICRRLYSVEALVSGYHPRDAKKVPVTGAGGRLQEWKNREFVWELRKTCFL